MFSVKNINAEILVQYSYDVSYIINDLYETCYVYLNKYVKHNTVTL